MKFNRKHALVGTGITALLLATVYTVAWALDAFMGTPTGTYTWHKAASHYYGTDARAFSKWVFSKGDGTATTITLAELTLLDGLSGLQPLDTDLTAIAALTSAANKIAYATGAGTWALADFTAAGRALMDDADAAAQRTTLNTGQAKVLYAATAASAPLVGTTTTETTTMPATDEGTAETDIGAAHLSVGSVLTFDVLLIADSDLDGGEKAGVNVYFGSQLVGTSGQVTLSASPTAIPVRGTVKIKTSGGSGTGVYGGYGGASAVGFGAAFTAFDTTAAQAFTIKVDLDGTDEGDSAVVADANLTWNNFN